MSAAEVIAGQRVELFMRRGLDEDAAAALADQLAARDADRDDRRMCIECGGLNRNGRCRPAYQGAVAGASRDLFPIQTILMRCERFTPATP